MIVHEEAALIQINIVRKFIIDYCAQNNISKRRLMAMANYQHGKSTLGWLRVFGHRSKMPRLPTLFRMLHAIGYTVEFRIVPLSTLEGVQVERIPVSQLRDKTYGED